MLSHNNRPHSVASAWPKKSNKQFIFSRFLRWNSVLFGSGYNSFAVLGARISGKSVRPVFTQKHKFAFTAFTTHTFFASAFLIWPDSMNCENFGGFYQTKSKKITIKATETMKNAFSWTVFILFDWNHDFNKDGWKNKQTVSSLLFTFW